MNERINEIRRLIEESAKPVFVLVDFRPGNKFIESLPMADRIEQAIALVRKHAPTLAVKVIGRTVIGRTIQIGEYSLQHAWIDRANQTGWKLIDPDGDWLDTFDDPAEGIAHATSYAVEAAINNDLLDAALRIVPAEAATEA